jgi:hypothetical protein
LTFGAAEPENYEGLAQPNGANEQKNKPKKSFANLCEKYTFQGHMGDRGARAATIGGGEGGGAAAAATAAAARIDMRYDCQHS